jgi:hypothetical protein
MKLTVFTDLDKKRALQELRNDFGREPSSLEVAMRAIDLAEDRERRDRERAKRKALVKQGKQN